LLEAENKYHKNSDGYKNLLSIAVSRFPDNFVKNGNLFLQLKVKGLSCEEMVKELKNSSLKDYARTYFLYKYYSKYEHFQSVSKILLDTNVEIDIDNLTESFFWVLQATIMISKIMNLGVELENKVSNLLQQVSQLNPLFKKK
jgi:hypothetical protein